MKLSRDESASSLIKKLSFFGYNQTRQTGSHIRITRKNEGEEQHITIPNHNPIRIGTLSAILKDVSQHLGISKEDLINKLYS